MNNSNGSISFPISDCSYEEFQYALAVGVTAPFYLTKLFMPHFTEGGAIVNMFVLLVRYKCKQGCRDHYYKAIKENHIDELSQAEEGCIRYEYSFSVAEDELLLTEVWSDAEAIEVHKNSDHFAKLGELKAEYVENTEFMKFSAEQVV